MLTRQPAARQREAPEQAAGEAIAFRLSLGVTGHRELGDEAAVRRAVVERLIQLRELFGPSDVTPVRFSVLTALAEGADRVVPQELMALVSDAELEVVLPLTVSDYLKDFESGDSREEFLGLLASARSEVMLANEPEPVGPARDAAYERAGQFIVDHCDVLVAVWDGEPGGRGGTSQIVKYAREEGVPVVHVPARDLTADAAVASESPIDRRAPRLRALLEAFARTDQYNRASVPEDKVGEALDAAQALVGSKAGCGSIQPELAQVADWAVPLRVRADVLAQRYQRYYRLLVLAVHLLAAMAVTAVAFQTVFFRGEPAVAGVEIFFLCALLVAVLMARRGRMHGRWIGYRSLAEAFRSGLFIALTDSRDRLEEGESHDVGASAETWPQRVFNEAWRRRPVVAYDESSAPLIQAFLVHAWIDDQIEYHREKAGAYQERRNRYTLLISLLAAATITLAFVHIFVVRATSDAGEWLELLAISLPAFGAAATGLREQGQHRLHQDRSQRAIVRLDRLKRQLGPGPTLESVSRLAHEIHRVIAAEGQDWWGVIEFQDVEVVI